MNPVTGITDGKVNILAQVFDGAIIVGAGGKITAFTGLLFKQVSGGVANVPARFVPQLAVKIYLANIV